MRRGGRIENFFFLKQKRGYKISAWVVGSERCIRERINMGRRGDGGERERERERVREREREREIERERERERDIYIYIYIHTSDAADKEEFIYLGAPRLIKKKIII